MVLLHIAFYIYVQESGLAVIFILLYLAIFYFKGSLIIYIRNINFFYFFTILSISVCCGIAIS